jgi:hypothetical protein
LRTGSSFEAFLELHEAAKIDMLRIAITAIFEESFETTNDFFIDIFSYVFLK